MYLDKSLRTAISEEAVSKWLVSCEFRTFHSPLRGEGELLLGRNQAEG